MVDEARDAARDDPNPVSSTSTQTSIAPPFAGSDNRSSGTMSSRVWSKFARDNSCRPMRADKAGEGTPLLLGLCFVAEGLQGRSGFIMSKQVSSDLYQKGRSSKDTKVDTAPKLWSRKASACSQKREPT
jgi:hypothetical protein